MAQLNNLIVDGLTNLNGRTNAVNLIAESFNINDGVLKLRGKNALEASSATDTWLRINNDSAFSSGIQITGYIRTTAGMNTGHSIVAGNTAREVEIDVQAIAKAGSIYLYSTGTETGNRGIYGYNAAGTEHSILAIDQDNVVSLNGNAYTATKLKTARTINGTNFDGSGNIITINWGTARNIYIADSDGTNTGAAVSVNGGANATLKLPATIKATLSGNASTATALTSNAGGPSTPIYFSGGKPVAVTLMDTCNNLINALSTGFSTPTDADYYVSQYVNGGTTTTTYHRRPMSALYAYVQGKTDARYLKLSGGTMTGKLTLQSNQYADDGATAALNLSNSNIIRVNAIYTADVSEDASKGINFYRDSTHYDTFWMAGGNMYFVPNRQLGTIITAANSNVVIHSGNYTSYTVTKTGSGASGTWGINISGNAVSANTSTMAAALSNNTKMDYGWNGLNYFNANMTAGNGVKTNDSPTTAWWHILRFNHANSAGYYTDLAIPFNNTGIYYKRICYGSLQDGGWVGVLDTLNYSNYAVTLTTAQTITGQKSFSVTPILRQYLKFISGSWPGDIAAANSNNQLRYELFSNSASGAVADTILRVHNNEAGTTYSSFTFKTNGDFVATRVLNAVWNDYAEYFPRGEETEPGDIVMLDLRSNEEKYIKAIAGHGPVVGVESNTYGHIVGGDKDVSEEEQMKRYIPVGLTGRVMVKYTGDPRRGDFIGASNIPGVGCVVASKLDAVGVVVDDRPVDGKIKIKIL